MISQLFKAASIRQMNLIMSQKNFNSDFLNSFFKQKNHMYSYKFNDKIIAIPFDNPLFPYNQLKLQITKEQFNIIKQYDYNFAAAIVRKTSDIEKKDQNLFDYFHGLATYCSCSITPLLNQYEIVLHGRHRINILSIKQLEQYPDAEQQQKSSQNLQLNLQFNNEKISMGQKSIIQLPHKFSLYEAEIEPIFNFVTQHMHQDLATHAKIKLILELQLKILKNSLNVDPMSNVNLNNIESTLDNICGFLNTLNYFSKEVLWDLFSESDLNKKLDKLLIQVNNYYNFSLSVQDIGQMAQENIKQKKVQEFFTEVFSIVKNAVEGQKGRKSAITKLSNQLKNKIIPVHVQEIFKNQTKRLLMLDEFNPESHVIQTYLEWLVSLPYGVRSAEDFDVQKAKQILDSEHYGMKEVKQRVLEMIAVGKNIGKLQGKIMCLVGPPGSGKTSFAQAIAQALKREYVRISLGGENDASVLKGHRKTYVGSYPGKIICALKEAKTENCVILLDEIDKLGRQSWHGDPSSTLLEILDPSQNNKFVDNYLDFPVDLSQVIFICSANITDTIPSPLLDRMDIMYLRSYTSQEKFQIYKRHILPQVIKESGLYLEQFQIIDSAITQILNKYAREPGVRSLKKYVEQIVEKVAYDIVLDEKNQNKSITIINENNLSKYIGRPKFEESNIKLNQSGIAIGLAYTEMGGSLIFLEAIATKLTNQKQGSIKCTGRLGKVIKESMEIAYTFAKNFAQETLKTDFFLKHNIHIHAPDGSTQKDGPSAGITIVTCLLSLALQKQTKIKLGMTGEISLLGKVMKIGGVKEKVIAAARENLQQCIFPFDNKNEIEKLDKELTEQLQFHYVKDYNDVYNIIFN